MDDLVHGVSSGLDTRRVGQDKLLIINQVHLRRVMREYSEFFNTARPYQGIEHQIPIATLTPNVEGAIRCRNVLSGISITINCLE